MTKLTNLVLIISLINLFFFPVNGGTVQSNDNPTKLNVKSIIYRNDENLTAFRIETDLDDNFIIIYGNESKDKKYPSLGIHYINISKFDKDGQLIWGRYLTDNFWSFGIYDLQMDSENNIHIVSWHHGWCGSEPPSFEYTKLSPNGINLYYKYFNGRFVQMRVYENNTVGLLYYNRFGSIWYDDENVSVNFTYEMNFFMISNEINLTHSRNTAFQPQGFLIENSESITILSNSTWRLSMTGNLSFISNLTASLSVSRPVIATNNLFIFRGNYDIKLLKLSNDYKFLEINRTLFVKEYNTKDRIVVNFVHDGLISIMQWHDGNITRIFIDPITNSTIDSKVFNIDDKILIDCTYSLNNSEILLLTDGDMLGNRVVGNKNIYLASQDIHFKDENYQEKNENNVGNDGTDNNPTKDIEVYQFLIILLNVIIILLVLIIILKFRFKKKHQ